VTTTDVDWGGGYDNVQIAPMENDPWAHLDGGATGARDQDAERIVVGSMLTAPRIIDDVFQQVRPEHFADAKLEEVAQIILELRRDSRFTDPLSVISELRERGRLGAIPAAYVYGLCENIPIPDAAPSHAAVIRQCAKLRAVGRIGHNLVGLARTITRDDIPAALARARVLLDEAEADNPSDMPPSAGDRLPRTLDRFEKPREVKPSMGCFGLRDLDDRFRGFKPGQVTLIAGRPGTGKSVLGLCIARATAMRMGHPVLLASLEMTGDEVMDRLVCSEARVDMGRIDDDRLDEGDWARIASVVDRITEAPLRIDDTRQLDLSYLRNLVRTLRRGPGCDLLIVDYLQLVTPPREQNREQSVAALSRGLKIMAGEFDIPIVALAQLNRESEKRSDKRPTKSDLRESGSLEQDADNVLLLHRPELYGEENKAGLIEVIVEKQRSGAPFTAEALFQGHYGRMVDKAPNSWTPSSAAGDAR
jgi:replicative DNA helicase